MTITIPKETTIAPFVEPLLLKMAIVEERLDYKPADKKITWTDQYRNTRDIRELTDAHAANLANWLRERGLTRTEEIIQAELERRCTGSYPESFEQLVQDYKNSPEIWRLQVHGQ